MSKLNKGKYDCYYGVDKKRGLIFIFNIHIYLITFILTDDRVTKWQYAALTLFFFLIQICLTFSFHYYLNGIIFPSYFGLRSYKKFILNLLCWL